MHKKLYFLTLIFLFSACKEIGEAYLGVPLQPRFDGETFIPGLNIFGVIRPDSTHNYNNSFVEVQKIMPAVGTMDSFFVDTTMVLVELASGSGTPGFCLFEQSNYDSVFSQVNYRPSCKFAPQPGDIYRIECTYEDLPVLTAFTIVPNKAKIIGRPLTIQNNTLQFTVKADTTIYMLDTYCFSNGLPTGFLRLPTAYGVNTIIEVGCKGNLPDSLEIYSYDYNLTKYTLESNSSLNFNKYRESFSVVENGYGVFGSANRTVVIINPDNPGI